MEGNTGKDTVMKQRKWSEERRSELPSCLEKLFLLHLLPSATAEYNWI